MEKEKYFVIYDARYDGGGIWAECDTLEEAKISAEECGIDAECIIKGVKCLEM